MALQLCTIEDLKSYLKGMEQATNYDPLLNGIIDMVTKRFEGFCDREWEDTGTNITEYHDGDGERNLIVVRRPPINAFTSLHDDVDRSYGSDTLIATTDYVTYDSGRVELDSLRFSKGLKNIQVIYQGGYKLHTVPEDLRLACLLQSTFIFKRRESICISGTLAFSFGRDYEPWKPE